MKISEIKEFRNGLPLIKCKPRKDGIGMMFYCDDCKRYHLHGEGDGERVSHCPIYNRAYYIELEE